MEPSQIELAKYRMEDALEKLKSAQILLKEGMYKDSLSRSYYALFSAMRSLLALRKLDSKKYSGVISLFNRHFVKTGVVDKSCGKIVRNAQISRERSDYGDYTIVSKEEAQAQIQSAEKLISEVKKALIREIGEF